MAGYNSDILNNTVSYFICTYMLFKAYFVLINILFTRIMSLSGSPIVNHGPTPNTPQILIPLGNGRVRVLGFYYFSYYMHPHDDIPPKDSVYSTK